MSDISRRRFLGGAAVAGGLVAVVGLRRLLDSGGDGGPGDVFVVSRPIVVDADMEVAGVHIEPGGVLTFDPSASVTLTSRGNVVVEGRLEMRPADPAVQHALRFADVSEDAFTGGGLDPLTSDVGLWVMGSGVLDLQGSPRTGWVRVAGDVAAGAAGMALASAPAGWQAGDELSITPTVPVGEDEFWDAFDEAAVASVEGTTLALGAPVSLDHPSQGGRAPSTAEVLNLTRNVRIEGTPGGRTHVFIRSRGRQTVHHVALRHVGPRQGSPAQVVLGRYGLHFHMCEDGSRGSSVEGVVIRDCGSHAFVPHGSHGVTMRDCIAHDVAADAFWWDLPERGHRHGTDDTLWERCVAARVQALPRSDGRVTLAGFTLGLGDGNVARDCVAVGVDGGERSSGFKWPSRTNEGVWTFEDCVAHNNRRDGLFVWQNGGIDHAIHRFVGYRNGQAGIEHGAYSNAFQYLDCVLAGNGVAGVMLHAEGREQRLRFERNVIEGEGVTAHGFEVHPSPVDAGPAYLVDCEISGLTGTPFEVAPKAGSLASRIAVVET